MVLFLAVVMVFGGFLVSQIRGGAPSVPATATVELHPVQGGTDAVLVIASRGGALPAALDHPRLGGEDVGYGGQGASSVPSHPLVVRDVHADRSPDGRRVTVRWRTDLVAGEHVVYPATPTLGVRLDSLTIAVNHGGVRSCLTSFGSTNGTPKLRPCHAGGSPLRLHGPDDNLRSVRLVIG